VIEGSERRSSPAAKKIGPADPNEIFSVTVVLRRRPDGPPVPDHSYFLEVPPHRRQRMPNEEFAKRYGALPDDIAKVTAFAQSHDLTVAGSNAAGRTVKLRGSVTQMSAAFAVKLARYEHVVEPGRRFEKQKQTYRGCDGFVYVPNALREIVVGVFGLDNRRIGGRNGNAEPADTHGLSVATVSKLYNYPTNSAAGQTIGIISVGGSYKLTDITLYFGELLAPTIKDIWIAQPIDSPLEYTETTMDITLAAAFAPSAAINVYFIDRTEQTWLDALTRVVHPDPGDAPCSVLSSSYFIALGDDNAAIFKSMSSDSFIDNVHSALVDAAIQGVTVCIASGDKGTDSDAGDQTVHVQYPGSDPLVLSVGGTTIGNVNVADSTFDEYVWNDPGQSALPGATGGGVSAKFGVPDYQAAVGVPVSISTVHPGPGRGVPDVAGNANIASGYAGLMFNGAAFTGGGTSASAPQWAGLIAVINAALGANVGFINPAIYALGSSVFRDIVPGDGPADNSYNGVPGYQAKQGWDACTGWGSPNGRALLDGLRALYTRIYFVVDKSTFGAGEVSDVVTQAGGKYPSAFWLVLEGFSINALQGVPKLSGAFAGLPGITVSVNPMPTYQYADELDIPQRIRFAGNVTFANTNDFPAAGASPKVEPLIATITAGIVMRTAEALFELVAGADPYFSNIDSSFSDVDPSAHQNFYLSQDLRVFTAAVGDPPLLGTLAVTGAPYALLKSLLHSMNHSAAYTSPPSSGAPDPLNSLPGQGGYETGLSSVTPLNGSGKQNYVFAVARVRLRGAGSNAQKVRVFFRLFVAESCDTDFDPDGSYKRKIDTSGLPIFPLPSAHSSDPAGFSLKTIPFFATDPGTHDYDGTVPDANIRDITIPATVPADKDEVWAYFGCYLNIYDPAHQFVLSGTHHCIVAEIAYDQTPIQNSNGVTLSPQNSDKLAQRNLQITSSGNPGYPDTHRIAQTFDTRASAAPSGTGQLLDYPDELMIDWGDVPAGSIAHIYWPEVAAHTVLKLATELYGTHTLRATDPHTIACKTTKGVTYIPIPHADHVNFAGLFTIDLPNTIHIGQEFNAHVHRITSRRLRGDRTGEIVEKVGKRSVLRNWRYVTGTFQVKIPVRDDRALLRPEENTLAILKWRLEHFSSSYRWRPVLQRYIEYISTRVRGFGGDPGTIKPSPTGIPVRIAGHGGREPGPTGKV
jgi:hypothetical protein